MGIGNTTASSAVIAALTGLPVAKVTGRGTGITAEALAGKVAVIEKALAVNKPDPSDPVDVLAKVGGLEIAALTGVVLGAAANRVPVVMDGFISAAAVLLAVRLCHEAVDYILPSHVSIEIGHQAVLDELGLIPLFDLEMRLGEGTGAVPWHEFHRRGRPHTRRDGDLRERRRGRRSQRGRLGPAPLGCPAPSRLALATSRSP